MPSLERDERSQSAGGDPVDAILLGIDGTGPLSDGAYHREMHNSFVRYIVAIPPRR
jgi:hypothetical protein